MKYELFIGDSAEQKEAIDRLTAYADFVKGASPFATSVREAMPDDPESLYPLSYIDIVDGMDNGGYGFLAPSVGFDKKKELPAIAVMSKAMQESGKRPLILSFDELYLRLAKKVPSIVGKMKTLKGIVEEDEKESYGLIVGGISQSTLFTEDALRETPSQQTLDQWRNEDSKHHLAFKKCKESVSKIFLCTDESPASQATNDYLKTIPEADRKLVFVLLILSQDIQNWQDLWWEGNAKKGPVLFIVAPTVFHTAMIRLNQATGHGLEDYLHRTTYKTSSIFPPEDRDDPPKLPEGIPASQFNQRIGIHLLKLAEILN